jgi:ribonuclease P/MRP protein subunit RPP40
LAKKVAYDNFLKQLLHSENNEGGKWDKLYKHIKQKRGSNSKITTLMTEGTCVTGDYDMANVLNTQYASVFSSKVECNDKIEQAGGGDQFTFSNGSIAKVISKLKNKKSPGSDGITNDFIKLSHEIVPYLRHMFQISINNCQIPKDWRYAIVTPIPKGGNKVLPENYRPISLTSSVCKVFEKLISLYMRCFLNETNVLVAAQHGFRGGYSCDSQLTSLIQDLCEIVDGHGEVDAILLDFAKAFDVVPHHILIQKLINLKLDSRVVYWIKEWLTNRSQRVRVGKELSSELAVTSGVPQGSVLGPLLFIIFINDIGTNISCNLRLFADDCMIYLEIKDMEDCDRLQEDVNAICNWVKVNEMRLNEHKSQLIKFTCKRLANQCKYNYVINSVPLVYAETCKYLGLTIENKLSWKRQTEKVVKKGINSLNFIMRNLRSSSVDVKEMAYKTIVLPALEYASMTWDPHQQFLKDLLEKVQRKAVRKVLCKYGKRHSPTEMLQDLHWQMLESRRKHARLVAMFKIMNGEIAWKGMDKYLRKATFVGKGSHQLKLDIKCYKTNVGKYSFMGATINDWNQLDIAVVDPWPESVEDFKGRLNAIKQK